MSNIPICFLFLNATFRDAVIMKKGSEVKNLSELPDGSVIGRIIVFFHQKDIQGVH